MYLSDKPQKCYRTVISSYKVNCFNAVPKGPNTSGKILQFIKHKLVTDPELTTSNGSGKGL